jgi:uncharacterized membrane protein
MELLMSRLSDEAHSRSLAKAVTWRFTATIDTFLISLIVTGKIAIAGAIAGTEIGTKILIYYFHERAWSLIPWGRTRAAIAPAASRYWPQSAAPMPDERRARHTPAGRIITSSSAINEKFGQPDALRLHRSAAGES